MSLKILLWTTIPAHYMRSLTFAVREAGEDMQVCYYERVRKERKAMGWSDPDLPEGELYVEKNLSSLDRVPDWRDRVHIVPGSGTAFLRRLAAKLSSSGVPWIHWSEYSHPRFYSPLTLPRKRRYARLVNKHALGAFGIGVTALRDFERWGMRRDRMAMIPYAPVAGDRDAKPDEACELFRAGRQSFIFLGTLNKNKAIDVLLRAFARATGKDGNSVLLLVGNDLSDGKFAALAGDLGISDRVLFRGTVPSDKIYEAIKSASVLVLPSHYDGWGVVLNEAASMGLALIATKAVGSSYHLIERSVNGFQVETGSVTSLADAMSSYCDDPGLAIRHGANSLRVFEKYAPEQIARRLIDTVEAWSKGIYDEPLPPGKKT